MIPLKLNLRNFLCYGEGVPVLDLQGIHVACLCGQNGHGKSALLDSMTWALWGKARGKTQEELIRYGSDEMLVDLEFHSQETVYRVTRMHSTGRGRRRAGITDLQFQVLAASGYLPITGNTLRETQAKVNQVTGMDYDTFINSAFLMQGRADEFTNKTPGERKDVLAKILGLGYYDLIQDRAKERSDEKKDNAFVIEGELQRMRQDISRKDDYVHQLESVNSELADVARRLEAGTQTLDALKMHVDDLRRKSAEVEEVTRRIPSIEADISHLQKQIDTGQSRIDGYQALVLERGIIESGLAQFQRLRQRYEKLNSVREQFDHLNGQKSELEKSVDSARARLEEQVKQTEKRVNDELRPSAKAAPDITQKLSEERPRLDELTKEEQTIADKRRYLNDLATRIGRLGASAGQLKSEGQELRSKLNLVQNSHQGARCPLCDTELGSEGCLRLTDGYNAQIQEKLMLYNENQSALEEGDREKLRLERELPHMEAALRGDRQKVQRNIAVLEIKLEESLNAARLLEAMSRGLKEGQQSLQQGTYATEEKKQLAGLAAQIESLGYDREAHNTLYDEMGRLQSFEERHKRLEEAVVNLPQERDDHSRAQEMYHHRQEELLASGSKLQKMEAEISQLSEFEKRLKVAEEVCRKLESSHAALYRRQIELDNELAKLDALVKSIGHREKDLKSMRDEQSIYQELADAFGKRGIQSMLIETILPRLEDETNSLLGRMTDNRMHLKLETQRERKSGRGEAIETLEIKISDEMGPRSYEMFSGGEAFRINLALRISLSKVLAHRRGAPLPTLFIDEGFGTQDAMGRERILDVISAIEDDFEKIIVITHLEELKEAFQARIEVEKLETGSTFWISY